MNKIIKTVSLNPFRTGRCFSTQQIMQQSVTGGVSIPFEQGDVFRRSRGVGKLCYRVGLNPFRTGRCFSTVDLIVTIKKLRGLNPFRTGRCFSTAAVCWRQESCGLSDPLPNFFGRLRSWLLI